jgi:hypothetical protein
MPAAAQIHKCRLASRSAAEQLHEQADRRPGNALNLIHHLPQLVCVTAQTREEQETAVTVQRQALTAYSPAKAAR